MKKFFTGLIVLIVAGLILGWVCFFKQSATDVHTTEAEPQTEKLDAPEQLNNPRKKIHSKSKRKKVRSKKFDKKGSDGLDDYYQVIVTNNLFRPLGWKEKKSGPSYTLLGTVIARNRGDSKALILDKNTKQTYYVAVGEKIGNAAVEKIASKKVVLRQQNGGSELKLGPLTFLKGVPRRIPIESRESEGSSLAKSQRLTSKTVAKDSHRGGERSFVHRFGSTTIVSGEPISREEAEARMRRMPHFKLSYK